jgi:hypothetical protein
MIETYSTSEDRCGCRDHDLLEPIRHRHQQVDLSDVGAPPRATEDDPSADQSAHEHEARGHMEENDEGGEGDVHAGPVD